MSNFVPYAICKPGNGNIIIQYRTGSIFNIKKNQVVVHESKLPEPNTGNRLNDRRLMFKKARELINKK